MKEYPSKNRTLGARSRLYRSRFLHKKLKTYKNTNFARKRTQLENRLAILNLTEEQGPGLAVQICLIPDFRWFQIPNSTCCSSSVGLRLLMTHATEYTYCHCEDKFHQRHAVGDARRNSSLTTFYNWPPQTTDRPIVDAMFLRPFRISIFNFLIFQFVS